MIISKTELRVRADSKLEIEAKGVPVVTLTKEEITKTIKPEFEGKIDVSKIVGLEEYRSKFDWSSKTVDDGFGILANQTGVVTNKWILVHDGTNEIIHQENIDQETVSLNDIETFDTEAELNARVSELKLIKLPEEELE